MPSTTITDISLASPEEWSEWVARQDDATFYHTYDWAAIWQDYTHGKIKPSAWILQFNDGQKVLLPLSKHKLALGLFVRYQSTASGKYGGWISDTPLNNDQQSALWKKISSLSIVVRENPYSKNDPFEAPWTINGFTQITDLRDGFDEVVKRWSSGHLQQAKKAKREGLNVVLGEEERDWEAYYKIYLKSLRRWGEEAQSKHEWSLFQRISSLASDKVRLWLVKLDNEIIGGAICFYHNRHISYWHASANWDEIKKRPMHLLIYEAMQHGCKNKFHWFDFNPSGGLDGVVKFKQGFGSDIVQSNSFQNQSRLFSSMKRLKKQFSRT